MHRLLWQSKAATMRSSGTLARTVPFVSSSSSTALKTDPNAPRESGGYQGIRPDIERIGVRRYLDVHKSSSLLLSAKERAQSFDALWSKITAIQPMPDVDLVNKYLYCMMDCGMTFDANKILEDLKKIGLRPNIRTYGAFIRQSCSRGNMEETSSHLQLLQEAHMVPDSSIFSHILYGYLKAGSPEEVKSTQEIMRQLGCWPSRTGYEGILMAHAELGDRSSLLESLNEACDTLYQRSNILDNSRDSIPFSNAFLVQLYAKLHCAESGSEEPCMELLSRLPLALDPIGRSRARESIKRLLAFGRTEAATELFKRTDPEAADDAYLISLGRYANVGGLNMDEVSRLWRLADASGARLNMLKRTVMNGFRRQNTKTSDLFVQLQEAFVKKDIDGIFKAIQSKTTDASATIYNHAIPQLLHLGLKYNDILKRIEPESARPAAAFGCLLGTIAPLQKEDGTAPSVDIKEAAAIFDSLKEQKLLPYNEFISISPYVCRRLLHSSVEVPAGSQMTASELLAEKFTILSKALSPIQLKAFISQLFETALNSSRSVSSSMRLSSRDKQALQVLIDACVLKNIKFPPNSWIFYTLNNVEISEVKCEQLKLADSQSEPSMDVDYRLPYGRRLRATIQSNNIDGAITLIQQSTRSTSSFGGNNQLLSQTGSTPKSTFFPDPVATAFEVLKLRADNASNEPISDSITASDVERLFWTAWNAQVLSNPLRAIGQVANAYFLTKDMEGMAGYFERSSKQFGNMLETILTQQNMKALLDYKFTANLQLLEQMIANPFLPLATATNAACNLEALILQRDIKSPEVERWTRNTPDYFPLQVLSKRFQGVSHLQKLRNIHNTVEELCKSGNLFAAHSLRLWATQMGLLLLPKTNELLVLTPCFATTNFRAQTLEKWALSHELCQHTPVSLSARQLHALDGLITPESGQSPDLPTWAQRTAAWLIENVSEVRSHSAMVDTNAVNYLPTWLVISQHLQYTGSCFNQPNALFTLATEWLKKVPESTDWQSDLNEWIRHAPSQEQKNALIIAAIFNPKSHDWVLKNGLPDSESIYALAVSETAQSLHEEQRKKLSQILLEHKNKGGIVELANALMAVPMDMTKIKDAAGAISVSQLSNELTSLVCAKHILKANVLQFLAESHPDILPTFFNDLLTKLRGQPRCLRTVRQLYDDLVDAKLDSSKLSVENQAFLFASVRVLDQAQPELDNPLVHLNTYLGSELGKTWLKEVPAAIARQDFTSLLELIEKLDSSKRAKALTLLTYALPRMGETHRLNKFLTLIAEHSDGELLNMAVQNARPFIAFGMGEAFHALGRLYRGEKLDWFDRACIRYHKLGPLIQAKGTFTAKPRQSNGSHNVDATSELAAMLRQPLSVVAESLVKAESDPEKLNDQLTVVSASWSVQRRNALLAYLTAEGASQVIERVISLTPEAHRPKQIPFQAFATMIRAHSNTNGDSEEAQKIIQSALASLAETPSSDVASCLKGPHVESLFRCWPNDQLPNLIKLVRDTSPTDRSSINLQLAAILVNRNRRDLADQLIKVIGPLPVTFLAGSPRHTLSPEDFKATLNYLREADPDHIPAFVDTCLRNAASTTSPNTEKMVNLVRTIADDTNALDLSKICLLPTLNLLAEFVRRNHKLPVDVKKLLDFTIESKGSRRQVNF